MFNNNCNHFPREKAFETFRTKTFMQRNQCLTDFVYALSILKNRSKYIFRGSTFALKKLKTPPISKGIPPGQQRVLIKI